MTTTIRPTARRALTAGLVTAAAASLALAGTHDATAATTTASTTASTTATSAATSQRLGGADRYATSVAISRHQFPTTARAVYLVEGSASVDALSAGSLGDGPLLLVPGHGRVPDAVRAEIRRLAPARVYAIGGTGVVSTATLLDAAQGRPVGRLGGPDRYWTADVVVRHAYSAVAKDVGDHATYFVGTTTGIADGVVAGVQADPTTPVLPLPSTGPAPIVVQKVAAQTSGGYGIAVGGTGALSDATFASAAAGMARGRLAGADRYATAVAVARNGRQRTPGTVYLARGDVFADALGAGSLTRGPLLLVPKDGVLPNVVAQYLREVRPARVVALGGAGSVSDRVLTAATNAASGVLPTRDVRLTNPYTSAGVRTPGWTVLKAAGTAPELSCGGPSVSGLVPGTFWCGGTAQSAHSCYLKPGTTNVVTCIVDPWRRTLVEYRATTPLPRTGPEADPLPVGQELGNGARCLTRHGGAWGGRGETVDPWASCDDRGTTALWSDPAQGPDTRWSGDTAQVRYGSYDVTKPLTWQDVTTRYFLG